MSISLRSVVVSIQVHNGDQWVLWSSAELFGRDKHAETEAEEYIDHYKDDLNKKGHALVRALIQRTYYGDNVEERTL